MTPSDDEVSNEDADTMLSVDEGTPGDSETNGPQAIRDRATACVSSDNKNVAPESKFPPLIRDIRPSDILLGRGALAIRNPGNVNFGHIVALRRGEYKTTSNRHTKDTIAKQVLQAVRNSKGRFVRKIEESDEMTLYGLRADENAWIEVDDSMATLKVKQSLRDKDSIRMKESLRRKYGHMVKDEGKDDLDRKPKKARKKQSHDCEAKATSSSKKSCIPINSTPSLGQHMISHSAAAVQGLPPITRAPVRIGSNGTTTAPFQSQPQMDGSSSSRSFSTMVSNNSFAEASTTDIPPSRISHASGEGNAAVTYRILAATHTGLEESNMSDTPGQQQQDRAGFLLGQGRNEVNHLSNSNLDALQALLQLRQANSSSTLPGQNQNHQGTRFGENNARTDPTFDATYASQVVNGFVSNRHDTGIRDWSSVSAPSLQYMLDMARRNQLQEQLQRQQLQLQLESSLNGSTQPQQLSPFDMAMLSLLQGGSGTSPVLPPIPRHLLYPVLPNNATFGVGVPEYNNSDTANNQRDEEVLRQHFSLSLLSGSNTNTGTYTGSAVESGLSNPLGFTFLS